MKFFRQSLEKLTAAAVLWSMNSLAATLPIYINNSPVNAPPQIAPRIDATAWVNRSVFNVTTFGSFGTPIPFESINTRFFTNSSAGVMNGNPGFRFFYNANRQRLPMDAWVNDGIINTDNNGFFAAGFGIVFINDSRASILQVSADNIRSTGPLLSSGAHGLVRLEGQNIDLIRTALRTGGPLFATNTIIGTGAFIGASNYVNDFSITDLYWGVGRGNAMAANRISAMRLDGAGVERFDLPAPSSPFHEVLSSGFNFPSTVRVPGGFFLGTNISGYTAAAYTNSLSPTSSIVQVVFYPTNGTDTNFTTSVHFIPQGGPASIVVAFNSRDFDISTQTPITESVYLIDGLAVETNRFLARNFNGATRRPSTYVLTRTAPFLFNFGLTNGNATFDPTLIYDPARHVLASVTNDYAAYSADISFLSSRPTLLPFEPTNAPGRIEIIGDRVNLDRTRIRADSAFILKANNLTSNRLAMVDAPVVNLDVRSIEPQLVISNVAPPIVRRLTGTISAWSGLWQNFETTVVGTNTATNTVQFHVLIVDSQLQAARPVLVNEFAARGNDVVISDTLNIGRSFVVEGDSLHVKGGVNLPIGVGLGASNVINVLNFTNDGIINVPQEQAFGTDRPDGYENYVNRGTNVGASHFIRTANFENPGCLVANGGVFELEATAARLMGAPLVRATNTFTNVFFFTTNVFTSVSVTSATPKIEATGELRITADSLVVSNSYLRAGTLILDVGQTLDGSGMNNTNFWEVTSGFEALRQPVTSDLLSVHLRSTLAAFGQAQHTWPAVDVGEATGGYFNNMAIGKLTLDGGANSLFRFSGTGSGNALYVDFVELLNATTNSDGTINGDVLQVDPDFTIYFANANVSVLKLTNSTAGRFRWVQDYAGSLSTTNITYPSGTNYSFNIALIASKDIDSDGDGIVNADDPTPICVPEDPSSSCVQSAQLTIASAGEPEPCVVLSWTALASSHNYLEFKASLDASNWEVLTNFVHGEFSSPVTVMDPLPASGANRVYRLRMVLPGMR